MPGVRFVPTVVPLEDFKGFYRSVSGIFGEGTGEWMGKTRSKYLFSYMLTILVIGCWT